MFILFFFYFCLLTYSNSMVQQAFQIYVYLIFLSYLNISHTQTLIQISLAVTNIVVEHTTSELGKSMITAFSRNLVTNMICLLSLLGHFPFLLSTMCSVLLLQTGEAHIQQKGAMELSKRDMVKYKQMRYEFF